MNHDRTVVVIYGNCQAEFLCMLLSLAPSLTSRFSFVLVTNNVEPGQPVRAIPEIGRAALYWEQYDQRPEVALRDAVRARLPSSCAVVRYPAIGLNLFWPFFQRDARNRPEPGFAFGRYPLGDRIAIEVAQSGLSGARAHARYMELSRQKMPNLERLLLLDRKVFEERDAACDVKMGEFVCAKLRSTYQFWTRGHLATPVTAELLARLLERSREVLGNIGKEAQSELEAAYALVPGQGEIQQPIHPLVIEQLGLTFANEQTKYRWFENYWTFEEYMTRYIAFDCNW